ncbi:MAG: rhodanese-like domain-containing protein [Gammaproteobacteria bacterium]|nr:rhodanese-like domain-containing protein [Gammaproteobacteria bacterium]MDH3449492.1 rhodanese-like domain-containing protein [Gammaproteobacteria bacterium]
MKSKLVTTLIMAGCVAWASASSAAGKPVGITPEMMEANVMHAGKSVKIMRDQNNDAVVNPAFAKTSRPCPPFCIQPIVLAPGVETLGEQEIIDYLVRMSKGDKSILVIDSRTPDWVQKGTIPGAINIPWTSLNPAKGADPISIAEIMEGRFGAKSLEGLWDYSNAKTLVMFCNGMWCGQSPNNIKNLLKFGYPANKIKWYRGGMQNWSNLGLNTAKPAG